jgi:hypothetical protein
MASEIALSAQLGFLPYRPRAGLLCPLGQFILGHCYGAFDYVSTRSPIASQTVWALLLGSADVLDGVVSIHAWWTAMTRSFHISWRRDIRPFILMSDGSL